MKKIFWNNERGFTLIEMMVVLLVITVILLIALPNVTKHSSSINRKGCDGLIHMVQGQVEAYRMEKKTIPTKNDLISENYMSANNMVCPNGKSLIIDADGKVRESGS